MALRTHPGISLALSTVYDTHVPAMNVSIYEMSGLPPRYRPPSIHPFLHTLTTTTFSPELLSLSLNCPPRSSSSCKLHHQLDLRAFHRAPRCTRFLARSRHSKRIWTHLEETWMAQFILLFKEKGRCGLKFSRHLRWGEITTSTFKSCFFLLCSGIRSPHRGKHPNRLSAQTRQF